MLDDYEGLKQAFFNLKFLCFAQSNYFEVSEYVYLVLNQQLGLKKGKFEILVHLTLKVSVSIINLGLSPRLVTLAYSGLPQNHHLIVKLIKKKVLTCMSLSRDLQNTI